MRDLTDEEWAWLLNGVAISELHPVKQIAMTHIPTDRLVELLDLKSENQTLKNKITELMLRIQKLGAE